ncbi:hypothetical protein [Pseudomonas sp. PSKL.D1]|uniref:hypothetical protein n=1 Tax=Pseudomonas sp. PSKL.D1 TaxID=3029060 RepID=UPI0023818361|nr:hypothetical protein [Pseudomonas sp. PSKL.D1]WDY57386.1 hypothetical protein PVV54_22865 [Pseudomonas sp. PSKL.D1]
MKRQRGVVLLLALGLSLLLALLAASALRDAMMEMRLTGYMEAGLKAFKQAEDTLKAGFNQLKLNPPAPCNACPPPARPHDLEGEWQTTDDGYYHLQNLGVTKRAVHWPAGEPVTLYRVTAVSKQPETRQVLEAVYAAPTALPQALQRILWRQRLREN